MMRKSTLFLAAILLVAAGCSLLLLAYPARIQGEHQKSLAIRQQRVRDCPLRVAWPA